MGNNIKELAKEAKNRIKSGYWQKSKKELDDSLSYAKENGLNESEVARYYKERLKSDLKKNAEEESFYLKVKEILDTYGEVGDMLGRLSDKEYLSTLEYTQKQKYLLELSEKYRLALERYKKEKELLKR